MGKVNITSKNQSGGITAQNVNSTDNSVKTKINGNKSKRKWLFIILAIIGALGGIPVILDYLKIAF